MRRQVVLALSTAIVLVAAWRVAHAVLDELGFRLFSEPFGPRAVNSVVLLAAPVVGVAATLEPP